MAFTWTVDSGATLSTSLVAAYNLEDSVGTDDKGGFTLTYHNSPSVSAGKNGNAIDGGSSNTNKFADYTGGNLGVDGGNCSISCWVNITTAPTSGLKIIVQQNSNTAKVGYDMFYNVVGADPRLYFRRDQNGVAAADVIVSSAPLGTGTWHHIVVTYNGTNVEGWLDGVSKGTTAGSGNGSGGGNGNGIGILGDIAGGEYLSGLIDAVYVWGKKLSNTEVADLYNSGTGSFYVNTIPAINVSDSISITETITNLLQSFISATQAISISESISMVFVSTISVSDSITISENRTITNSQLGGISVSDALTLTESRTITNSQLAPISVSDTLTLGELITKSVALSGISTSDALTLSENIAVQVPLLGNVSVLDSVTITETLTMLAPGYFLAKGIRKMQSKANDWPLSMDDQTIL